MVEAPFHPPPFPNMQPDNLAVFTFLKLIDAKLNVIIASLERLDHRATQLELRGNKIMATLADINTAVEAEETVEASVVALLQQLSAQLAAAIAANDPAAMQAVVDKINNDSAALAAAVTANTQASGPTGPTGPDSGPTGPDSGPTGP